jgi:GNAT superfamily N-acetyltransferase
MLAVRPLTAGDLPTAVAIVRGLPDYFTDDVPGKVERDCARGDAWVLTESGEVAAFAVTLRKSPGGAEIAWFAVEAARRRHGLGTALLGQVIDALAASGVAVVEVKTLDASAGYPPYEATRAFWERGGFVLVDTIDPLPDWEPGSPAAVYVAAVRPTR